MKGILSRTGQSPFDEIPSEKTGSPGVGDWDRADGLGSVVTGSPGSLKVARHVNLPPVFQEALLPDASRGLTLMFLPGSCQGLTVSILSALQ